MTILVGPRLVLNDFRRWVAVFVYGESVAVATQLDKPVFTERVRAIE